MRQYVDDAVRCVMTEKNTENQLCVLLLVQEGHAVVQLVEVLRDKSEGRGFDSRFFSGRTMALGLTQPLTEMSTRNISWGEGGVKAAGA